MPLKLLITVATCVLLAHANPQALPVADDTETFITKEAAKELRNKLSSSNEQQDDYDEILKGIIHGLREKPKNDQQQIFYEKKYFDYLPNEIVDSDDETSEDLTHESVNPDSKAHESSESVRAKREAPVRKKRFYQPGYQIISQPLHHFSPLPQVSFYFPTDLFSDYTPTFTAYNVPQTYNYPRQDFNTGNLQFNPGNPNHNPNGRFQPPGNFYLPPITTTPPPPPRGYLPASHHTSNLPHPPNNNPEDFENRVGGFEGNDNRPIFEVRPVRPVDNNYIINEYGGKGGSGNDYRRTNMPNTTPSQFNFDLDSFGKDSKEVQIEYAPEIEEEVSTTTRASIRRPTKKNQNKNHQQNGRQKKSDSEDSTTTTERTNISQQDLSVTNNAKPNKPLSACVEAIVNCCSKFDEIVRLPCFEAFNCSGAFFGRSACSKDIQKAAFKEVEKYSEAERR